MFLPKLQFILKRVKPMSMIEKQKVYQFIDDYYENAMRRPRMYFSCPDAAEDVVFQLESLRDDLDQDFRAHTLSSYADFCVSRGLGVARLITRFREARPEGFTDDEFYEVFVPFLKDYLAQRRGTKSDSAD